MVTVKMLDNVNAILFDCGETLVTLQPSREDIFVRAANSIGVKLEPEAVRRAYQLVDFGNKYSSVNKHDRQHFYRTYNSELCDALGISGCFEELSPALVTQFEKETRWTLIEGVNELLATLASRDITLGIVANWDSKLSALAEALGIRNCFKLILASEDVGVEKPDPQIFRIALERLSLSDTPNSVLYVGNEYRADVTGARAAGLKPVLIDRANLYPHADCLRLTSLTEFQKAIA